MKRNSYHFLLLLCVLSAISLNAQSPYLSVKAIMLRDSIYDADYSIELQICSVKKGPANSKLFSGDTTKIDFTKLLPGDFNYSEPISGSNPHQPQLNKFSYSNQVYAFEKILILRIMNRSSAGLMPAMFVVIPIKYESFVTFVEISNIVFESGEIIYLDKVPNKRDKEKHLVINESLKHYPSISMKEFPLKLKLEEF